MRYLLAALLALTPGLAEARSGLAGVVNGGGLTFGYASGVGAGIQIVFPVVGATTWVVPLNWNSANNVVEVIGAGGGGSTATGTHDGAGGGGAAYSAAVNVTLTPGATVGISVPSGGAISTTGGDTYFCNSTSNCASIAGTAVLAGAHGGTGSVANTAAPGAGGSTTGAVGSTRNAGGIGGANANTTNAASGGGGGGGPNGAGAAGGANTNAVNSVGAGGGGNGGGVAAVATADNSNGTAGGNNSSGSGAGAGGTSSGSGSASPGAAGIGGGGGGGGGQGADGTGNAGGAGGAGGSGTEWGTSGSGGGGGGGGSTGNGVSIGGDGGAGANCGGGGGGGAFGTVTNGHGGTGGTGCIRITYYPAAASIGNTALRDPMAQDDLLRGNPLARLWLNTNSGVIWRNTSPAPGNATWTVDNNSTTLPCDIGTPLVCYGVAPLKTAWAAGNLFDVQRVSDSTTQTIAGVAGATDIAALNTFLSGTAGRVTRWYDQSGNASNTVTPSQTTTITNASPGVFTSNNHGLHAGNQITLTTTGALPTGLATSTTYFVIAAGLTANAFEVSASLGGSAINTSSAGSGTQTWVGTIANYPWVRVVNNQAQIVCDAKEAQLTNSGIVKFLWMPGSVWTTSLSMFHVAQDLRQAAQNDWEAGTTSAAQEGIYNSGSDSYADWAGNNLAKPFGENNLAVWSIVSTASTSQLGVNENLQSVSSGATTGSPVGGTFCNSRAQAGNFTADTLLYAAVGYASALSLANQKLVREALYQKFQVPPQLENDVVVMDGASYSAGEGSFFPAIYPSLDGLMYGPSIQLGPLLNRPVHLVNYAVPGQTMATMGSNFTAHITPEIVAGKHTNTIIVDEGGNGYPQATATEITDLQSYCTAAVARAPAFMTTLIAAFGSSPPYQTWSGTVNTAIRSSSGCSGFIDIAADANLGSYANIGGSLPNTWFNNDTSPHPTAFGYGSTEWDAYISSQANTGLGP